MSTERYYELHGVGVRVASDRRGPLETAHLFLEHFGLEPVDCATADLLFELRGEVHLESRRPGQWVEIPGCGLSVLDEGDEVTVRSREAEIRFDPRAGRAELTASRNGDGRFNVNLLSFALLSMLRGRKLYPLHAACVAQNGAGLLIVADSGGGKTTLAGRLMMSGWSYLSDDSVLLRPVTGGVEALALRRDLFVRPGSLELADGTDPETWRDTEKLRVDVRRRFRDRLAERCPVSVTVFPEIVGRDHSSLETFPAEEALRLATQQSLVAELDRSFARPHLEALARLVTATRCWRLEAGRDLIKNPGRAHTLLLPLVSGDGVHH